MKTFSGWLYCHPKAPGNLHTLAFGLLRLGEESLLTAPYDQRRALLEQLPMPDPYQVSMIPAFTFDGLAADRSHHTNCAINSPQMPASMWCPPTRARSSLAYL